MAEENELAFDTADVTAMQDNDPAIRSESDVVSFVQGRFKRAEDVRQQDEQRWLKAYRNYRGLYGPDVQFTETEKSRVFVKVTKTKTLAAYGQIIDVLFDDTKESIGSKLATADLIGFPYQVIIGPKGIKSDSFEIKTRKTNKIINLSLNEIFNFINENMV